MYSEDKKREILEYAAEHGVVKAAKEFGVSRDYIYSLNKKYNILHVREYPDRKIISEDKKKEILEYAAEHGVVKAAKEFGVGDGIIYFWNKKYNILHVRECPDRKIISEDKKKEILEYAEKYGINPASEKFGVTFTTIAAWNKKLGFMETEKHVVYSEEFKKEVLEYAVREGRKAASIKYNVSRVTMFEWNKNSGYAFWEAKPPPRKFTEAERLAILKEAAEYGVVFAARKFNVSAGLISGWNRRYKVYKRQWHRSRLDYSVDQKKEALRRVLDVGYEAAGFEMGVSCSTLMYWNEEFRIVPSNFFNVEENQKILEKMKHAADIKKPRERRFNAFVLAAVSENQRS